MKEAKYLKDYEIGEFASPAGPFLAFKMYSAEQRKTKKVGTVLIYDRQTVQKELQPQQVKRIEQAVQEFHPSDNAITNSNTIIFILEDEFVASLPFLPKNYNSEDAILFGLNSLESKEYTNDNNILVKLNGTYQQFGKPIENQLFQIFNSAVNSRGVKEEQWISLVKEQLTKEEDLPNCEFSIKVKNFIISEVYDDADIFEEGEKINTASAITPLAQEYVELLTLKESIDGKILKNYILPILEILLEEPENHQYVCDLIAAKYVNVLTDEQIYLILEPIVVACTYQTFELKLKRVEQYEVYTSGVKIEHLVFKYNNPYTKMFEDTTKIKDALSFTPNMDSYLTEEDCNFQQSAELSIIKLLSALLSASVNSKCHEQVCMFIFTCLTSYSELVMFEILQKLEQCMPLFSQKDFVSVPYYEYEVDFSRPFNNFLIPTLLKVVKSTDYANIINEIMKIFESMTEYLSDTDVVDVLFKEVLELEPLLVKYPEAAVTSCSLSLSISKRLGYKFTCEHSMPFVGYFVGSLQNEQIFSCFEELSAIILGDLADTKKPVAKGKEPVAPGKEEEGKKEPLESEDDEKASDKAGESAKMADEQISEHIGEKVTEEEIGEPSESDKGDPASSEQDTQPANERGITANKSAKEVTFEEAPNATQEVVVQQSHSEAAFISQDEEQLTKSAVRKIEQEIAQQIGIDNDEKVFDPFEQPDQCALQQGQENEQSGAAADQVNEQEQQPIAEFDPFADNMGEFDQEQQEPEEHEISNAAQGEQYWQQEEESEQALGAIEQPFDGYNPAVEQQMQNEIYYDQLGQNNESLAGEEAVNQQSWGQDQHQSVPLGQQLQQQAEHYDGQNVGQQDEDPFAAEFNFDQGKIDNFDPFE